MLRSTFRLPVGRQAGGPFDARVVERVIEPSVRFYGEIHQRFHVGFLACVRLEVCGDAAGVLNGFDHRLALGGAAAADDDPGAQRGKFAGDGGADAAGGAGDESNFVLEGGFHILVLV